MAEIESERRGPITIRYYHDPDCASPREDDNVGTIAAWHRRHTLGDEQPKDSPIEFRAALPAGSVILPVYLYEHSGLALNTTGFHCPWDSGQVGWIYTTPEKIRAAGWNPDSADDRAKVEGVLRAEVDEYATWLNGECYGFTLAGDAGGERAAFWGFIGLDACREGAAEQLPYYLDKENERLARLIEAERPDMYGKEGRP